MTWTWILNPNETNGEQLYNCEERRRNSLWVFAKSKSGLRATHHRHWHWHGRHRHHGRHGHRWHHRPRSLVIFSCFDISTFTVGNGGNGGTPQCLAAVAPGQIDEPPKILKEVFLKSVTQVIVHLSAAPLRTCGGGTMALSWTTLATPRSTWSFGGEGWS